MLNFEKIWWQGKSIKEKLFYVLVLKFCEMHVYAGVHDSFWTHACDVEKMSQILREKFVELYSMPILENVIFFLYHEKLWLIL